MRDISNLVIYDYEYAFAMDVQQHFIIITWIL
jgi:hypothetical protein